VASKDGEIGGGGGDGDVGAGTAEYVGDDDGLQGLGAVGDRKQNLVRSGHESCGRERERGSEEGETSFVIIVGFGFGSESERKCLREEWYMTPCHLCLLC